MAPVVCLQSRRYLRPDSYYVACIRPRTIQEIHEKSVVASLLETPYATEMVSGHSPFQSRLDVEYRLAGISALDEYEAF